MSVLESASAWRSLRSLAGIVLAFAWRRPLCWAFPLQALLLLPRLDLLDLWSDEYFTMSLVVRPVRDIVAITAGNVHPPLYYLLLHWWTELSFNPGSLEISRAMSVAWALLATSVIYLCWLRGRESLSFQNRFLALWSLSPCLLLHTRMARSYSMQVALAPFVVWAALRWIEKPRDGRLFALYVMANGALLYTHYLSGVGLAAAVFIVLLTRRRYRLASVQSAAMTLLYLPWLPVLVKSMGRWVATEASYEGSSLVVDQIVRLAYLFVAFAFGETFPAIGIAIAVAMVPVVSVALWRSLASPRPDWLPFVLIACALAWIGVSKFEQFIFMPTGLFFALPFFLLLVVRQLNRLALASLLVLYVCADYAYFDRSGFLAKPYAVPSREMANVIQAGSVGRGAILVTEPFGSFAMPLVARLGADVRTVSLDDASVAADLLAAWRVDAAGRPVIWVWRHTADVSPGGFVTRFEQDLAAHHEVRIHEFVPYSVPERWARRLLRGPGQTDYYYRLMEVR